MKHFWNFVKGILFLFLLSVSLFSINGVLKAKFIMKNCPYPTTSSFRQFYEMDRDSVDVLFIGASVCANAFIPQEIYNDYGIRSYNLASEEQSVFFSYYWLKEALRFQKPKVVVLEALYLQNHHPESPVNTLEALTRKALDRMKWSPVKMEAVHNLCQIDTSQSELSYYLTNIRYHARWSRLEQYDMDQEAVDAYYFKGFAPYDVSGPASFTPYHQTDPEASFTYDAVTREYLDKIVDLCREKGITLILISLPVEKMKDATINTHKAYADSKNIDYYNFAEADCIEQIGARLPEENIVFHQNVWGAIKTSRYIGKILQEEYGLGPVQDPQYENTRGNYEHLLAAKELLRIEDQSEYLQKLNDPDYAVFFATQGNAEEVLEQKEVKEGMEKLGLKCLFADHPAQAYTAAVIGKKTENEKTSGDKIKCSGSFNHHRSVYLLTGTGKGQTGSAVTIEGSQESREKDGLNIVVYDLQTLKVIDKVTFRGTEIQR